MAKITVLYTDTDAIRSAIGADSSDIEDTIITGQSMALQMQMDLEKFMPDHATQFYSSTDIANRLQLWCMWYGAWRLAQSPPALPRKLTTGKDEYQRFSVDWKALVETARTRLDGLQEELVPNTSGTAFTIMGKATPSRDPITGV